MPENNISGPNPLAHVPSILSAPEMGIPVNPATEATAEISPNLYISLEVQPHKGP